MKLGRILLWLVAWSLLLFGCHDYKPQESAPPPALSPSPNWDRVPGLPYYDNPVPPLVPKGERVDHA